MKAICVLLVLALAVFGGARAEEQVADIAVVAADAAGAMDMVADVEESADEAEVEGEDEEAVDAEAEDEAEEEAEEGEEEADEFSLIEAEAEAQTEDEKAPKKLAKILKAKKRAPKPLKKRAAPFKFHPERLVQADTLKGENPEMAKLNLALAAVKEDILSTNKQITDERKWVIAVAKIIASYNNKMKRVEGHIIALRKEMKSLYRKKKQIENLKLQKALEAKLKEAKNELATLSSSLKHVAVKQGELNKSGTDLRATIAGIQAQLRKLRGQAVRKPKAAAKGKCGRGLRFSRKAKKCVPRKPKAHHKKAVKAAKKH